jgi:membrane fusion protein, multidrug efflux system
MIVGGLLAVAGLAWGAWHLLALRHVESTDNAYVQGNVVQITPQVAGTVVSINVDDTDVVKAGQPLVKLDPADAQLALDQAQAQLGQTVREVRTMYANNSTLKAQISLREAEVARAQAELARAQDDVARRKPLVATGAVGQEEFSHAMAQLAAQRSAVVAAQSAVAAAQEQLNSNQSMTQGTPVDQHPSVQRAAARVREAYLALKRAELLAPLDGVVARRSVQIGQRVAAGAPLMTVVALDKLWVDANFKEGQLQRMHVGQAAKLVADVYGRKVEYHGRVAGLGAGTGAAFALLPAQNATGNWIKIVQRVPVRIALDPRELEAHPLRIGLSTVVDVDTRPRAGDPRQQQAAAPPAYKTDVYEAIDGHSSRRIQAIIAANL